MLLTLASMLVLGADAEEVVVSFLASEAFALRVIGHSGELGPESLSFPHQLALFG
jgi:hypothetical protein